MKGLPRRAVLALALGLAACGGGAPPAAGPQAFPPLDFSYLLPLPLNVATIEIVQRFIPSGQPPDVSELDPIQPVQALRQMAAQRLRAEGVSGRAVFIINDASIARFGDIITATFSVELDIFDASNIRTGFAQATVSRQVSGGFENLPATLYALTRQMMDQMNVEFEYQVRHNLAAYLLPSGAARAPVQSAPLEAPPAEPGTPLSAPPAPPPPLPEQLSPSAPLSPPPGPLLPPPAPLPGTS